MGDAITAVDGKKVNWLNPLLDELEKHQPGDTLRLTIIRKGNQMQVTVRLAAGRVSR